MNKELWRFEKQMEILKQYVQHKRDGTSNLQSPQPTGSVVSDDKGNNTEAPQLFSTGPTPLEILVASPRTPTSTKALQLTNKMVQPASVAIWSIKTKKQQVYRLLK